MNSCEKSNNFKKGCVPTKRVPIPAYFETVVVPASLGPADPKNGEYKNSLVKYEADGRIFLFDGRGIFTELVQKGAEGDFLTIDSILAGENVTVEKDTANNTVTISADGQSVVLYTTTGANEDGAMTQKATSNLIYPDGKENARDRIAIGRIANADTVGQNTIQIRGTSSDSAPVTSVEAVSITSSTTDTAGNYAVGIGDRTTAGEFATAIGSNVVAEDNNTAIGSAVSAYGGYSTAIGYSTRTGDSATTGKNYAVALGSYSKSGRDSEISVGSGTNNANHGKRYVANVKDPELASDAATKGYTDTADTNLQAQIDTIVASSDVTDIVGTYAELQAYDTSTLGDKDIIKVLQDETHNDETTYYRWSTTTQTFTLIGEEGPYYTKAAANAKFVDQTDYASDIADIEAEIAGKQDTLTAGANITIDVNNEISATDTTYSDFTGTDGTTAGASGLVPAPATTDAGKFLKADGTWDIAGGGGTGAIELTTADYDYPTNNPTGIALWDLPNGDYYIDNDSGVNLFGASAMNYNAAHAKFSIDEVGNTSFAGKSVFGTYSPIGSNEIRLFGGRAQDSYSDQMWQTTIGSTINNNGQYQMLTNNDIYYRGDKSRVLIGSSATSGGTSSVGIGSSVYAYQYGVAIGVQAVGRSPGVGIGYYAGRADQTTAGKIQVTDLGSYTGGVGDYSVALGSHSVYARASEVAVGDGSSSTDYGTRYIANVRDPQLPQDAATKNYVDTAVASAGATVLTNTEFNNLWENA